jgi:hypothetical protein
MAEHYRSYRSGTHGGDAIEFAAPAALANADYEVEGDIGVVRVSEQFARDIAEIERAAAALRRAQPGLETWNETWTEARADDAALFAVRKARPVWLLIGALWLSTALVTVGAVAAIARLIG